MDKLTREEAIRIAGEEAVREAERANAVYKTTINGLQIWEGTSEPNENTDFVSAIYEIKDGSYEDIEEVEWNIEFYLIF